MVFNSSIRYVAEALSVDDLDADSIVSETGTPVYIYSLKRVMANFHRLQAAFSSLNARIHFSVKANGSLAILRASNNAGSGFDCVSAGEIHRTLKAGAVARDIVFAGVGKTREEIAFAVSKGIGWFNVENLLELRHINDAATRMGVESVRVALRLNPQVAAKTHRYMATGHGAAKFGLTADVIREALAQQDNYPRINIAGIHMHIGSQLSDSEATLKALDSLLELIGPYAQIRTINLGGGLPVAYRTDETIPSFHDLAAALADHLRGYKVLLEPGRSIVADAGMLVAEVLYVKRQAGRVFYIVDASMAELIRPALYEAHHEVAPLRKSDGERIIAQVVGPVCESADVLARDRELPLLREGDKVALMTAGAYGMSMASNYNARLRPAEVVVAESGDQWRISRRRETFADLLRNDD